MRCPDSCRSFSDPQVFLDVYRDGEKRLTLNRGRASSTGLEPGRSLRKRLIGGGIPGANTQYDKTLTSI